MDTNTYPRVFVINTIILTSRIGSFSDFIYCLKLIYACKIFSYAVLWFLFLFSCLALMYSLYSFRCHLYNLYRCPAHIKINEEGEFVERGTHVHRVNPVLLMEFDLSTSAKGERL